MQRSFTIASLVGGVLLTAGCGADQEEKTAADASASAAAPASSADADGGHSHGSGPHGGAISDWGGGAYHVEFTVDHDKKQSTVYVLGSDGQTPAPIAAAKIRLTINEPEFEVDLEAQPLEDEPSGQSSRFVGRHDNLGIVREFAGSITGEADGTPYAGDFAETAE